MSNRPEMHSVNHFPKPKMFKATVDGEVVYVEAYDKEGAAALINLTAEGAVSVSEDDVREVPKGNGIPSGARRI